MSPPIFAARESGADIWLPEQPIPASALMPINAAMVAFATCLVI
jgi:hypothetical protein